MKHVALPLSGAVATLAGVSIRSCFPAIPSDLLTSFCGKMPTSAFGLAQHGHCAGCALIVAGAAMIAAAFVLRLRRRPLARARIAR